MSDRFHPVTMEQLTAWVFTELEQRNSIFGIPRELFFVPDPADRFRTEVYGRTLETPLGVAAGPHTQMAQNIVVAWLCGARFIELKTIQTLDELDIAKPCIDMEDEGYNVEWSQELKVFESFDEYLRAWVLIHALHDKLGFAGDSPGMVFNMSVGYNLEGIRRPNVQWYFAAMRDASAFLGDYVELVAAHHPGVGRLDIPATLSDSITLSTMHGCPPDEIEAISTYLMTEQGLHTSVKCNPTLLGPDGVRGILHDDLGYTDIPVPDSAFGHDLTWADAVPMLHALRAVADRERLQFGVKLSNTLEVENWRPVFAGDEMMYLSGRALHAVTVNLAHRVAEEFAGDLMISFAGGADCFNVPDLLAGGMRTVTMCSDLLKSGGYLRLLQYLENLDAALDAAGAADLDDFIVRAGLDDVPAGAAPSGLEPGPGRELFTALRASGSGSLLAEVDAWAAARAVDGAGLRRALVAAMGRVNLAGYATAVRSAPRLRKDAFLTDRSKTDRTLGLFDCIEAPCVDECPVDQQVPHYMEAVRTGDLARAVTITRADNPLGAILGHVCDHLCEHTCVRTHYDEPLAIREIKRFIMSAETPAAAIPPPSVGARVAVIGAGPLGLAAAEGLAAAGLSVTVFEAHPYAGGMVGGAIPVYRIPDAPIAQDLAVLAARGVEIVYGRRAGRDFSLADLRERGYRHIVIGIGAQAGKQLGLPGEDAAGVLEGVEFLRSVREGRPVPIGQRVAVIGAGDTAMDCARSAWRLGSDVTVLYRRTIDQMPADREEVAALLEEGITVEELVAPIGLEVSAGRLTGIECIRMEYRGDRDRSGRKVPHRVEGSEHRYEADTLILAISQDPVLDVFDSERPELTDRGTIAVDPVTLETSLPGVYAGGDVAADGPQSIVKAAGDGKRIAAAIAAAEGLPPAPGAEPPGTRTGADTPELLRRRARREWRVPVTHIPVVERRNFEETIRTYTPAEAMAEAARCLDCHLMCSLCVGVCPNLAFFTYRSQARSADLPVVAVGAGAEVAATEPFRVEQRYQVAVLTDFCNECGNCATFCPTAGLPYVDKPRLYLDREDFEAQADNAFMVTATGATWAMEGRFAGATHRIELDGELSYTGPEVRARFDPTDLTVLDLAPGRDAVEGSTVSTRPAGVMLALLDGLRESMTHLPPYAAGGTRVGHPGYAE